MPFKDNDRRKRYQREYRRLRRSGDDCTSPCLPPVIPPDLRVRTAADLLLILDEQLTLVRAARLPVLDKARGVGFLCGVALKAIEAKNVVARLEAIEAVLKQRSEA